VDDYEVSKKKVVKKLKSIKKMDDIKKNREKLLTLIEEFYKTMVQSAKEFNETAEKMPPEEIAKEIAKFQDENYITPEEIGQQFDRLDSLPDINEEYVESFIEEMQERTLPIIEERNKYMTKILDKLAGNLVEGMVDGFGEMMGETFSGTEEEDEEDDDLSAIEQEYDDEIEQEDVERVHLDDLDFIYEMEKLDEFREQKDDIFGVIEKKLIESREWLEDLKDSGEITDEDKNKFKDIEMRRLVYLVELEKELYRLGMTADEFDDSDSIKLEMLEILWPISADIGKLIKEMRGKI
jgi:hypothetical protein